MGRDAEKAGREARFQELVSLYFPENVITEKELILKEKVRRDLLQNTFRLADGERCTVGGWNNSIHAMVVPDSGGFFFIPWESLKRAKENNESIYPDY